MKRRTLNSTYPIGGVHFRSVSRSFSKDSFMVNQKLVNQIKFRGESPPLLLVTKRYVSIKK